MVCGPPASGRIRCWSRGSHRNGRSDPGLFLRARPEERPASGGPHRIQTSPSRPSPEVRRPLPATGEVAHCGHGADLGEIGMAPARIRLPPAAHRNPSPEGVRRIERRGHGLRGTPNSRRTGPPPGGRSVRSRSRRDSFEPSLGSETWSAVVRRFGYGCWEAAFGARPQDPPDAEDEKARSSRYEMDLRHRRGAFQGRQGESLRVGRGPRGRGSHFRRVLGLPDPFARMDA